MGLQEEARDRLVDIVELQPTKNAALQERWGLESGSEVHSYLEDELGEYYYRNDDSLICATPEAESLVGDASSAEARVITGTELQQFVLDALPGPDDEPQSVVATLHGIRDAGAADPEVDAVRSALHTLVDKGLVERVRKSVPTFRLAVERAELQFEVSGE